jgi:hypothetical protein
MVDDDEYYNELMEKAKVGLEYHELSTVFSSFEDTVEFKELVDSIKKEGLNHSILIWQDKIVDGRHRHKACRLAGVEPHYEYLPDDMSLQQVMDRVIAENILRRHLTTGQRAMIAASLANMTHGGDRKSDQGTNSSDDKSNKSAAKSLNVGPTAVKDAKEVKRDAPDLARKVERGEMTLNAAKTESRQRKGEPPKATNAPGKPKSMSLDEMMKIGGDNWDSYVAAGAIVSTVRDLHLQEGGKGMVRVIMHFLTSREDRHSHAYNAAGLLALYKELGHHIEEIEDMAQYKTTEAKH